MIGYSSIRTDTEVEDLKKRWQESRQKASYIGLVESIPFDHESVVSLAHRFKDREHFFLLESASSGPHQVARYSFMGFDPLMRLEVLSTEEILFFDAAQKKKVLKGQPLDVLKQTIQENSVQIVPKTVQDKIEVSDLVGASGLVGFLSYDISQSIEPSIGDLPEKDLDMPLAHFVFPRHLLVYDHFFRKLLVICFAEGSHPNSLEQSQEGLAKSIAEILKPSSITAIKTTDGRLDYESPKASLEKSRFLEKAKYCLEQIKKGEIFQVQIGNRLSVETDADPFDIFRHLRILNPSPYMFFYKFGDDHIIGASPEMMVNVEGGRVTHRPIAGTRRRTWNAEKDKRVCEELSQDEKEKAEHIMLVDLSRNDIGRLAKPGSVSVEELMIVEKYSHVFHMVSQVSGDLGAKWDVVDAMKYSFPNGTVSGAPKIRAMQIINELEPIRREFYAGSLGVFSFDGNLKSTILIRTLHYRNGVASTQASAGIVYDSVPELEWKETQNKMAACLTAMQNTL